MQSLELEIRTVDNAFQDGNAPHELARILRETADKIEAGADYGRLFDVNGNHVGQWSYDVPEDVER